MVGLHLEPEQYKIYCEEVKYLRLIISLKWIKMDLEKIHTIQDCEPPSNLKDVHVFLGFVNFYCCFVHNYSYIVQPITFLT
jgi:hypothetical protein